MKNRYKTKLMHGHVFSHSLYRLLHIDCEKTNIFKIFFMLILKLIYSLFSATMVQWATVEEKKHELFLLKQTANYITFYSDLFILSDHIFSYKQTDEGTEKHGSFYNID